MLSFPRFQIQSASVAQPLVGSWITAGIAGPSNQPLTLTLGTACSGSGFSDSQIFLPGNEAWLIDPNGKNGEKVIVQSIVAGANVNQIVIGPQTQAGASGSPNPVTINSHTSGGFGTGTFIALNVDVNSVYVQPEDGNAGTFIYIGNNFAMTATYKRVVKLAKVSASSQPNDWSSTETSPGNPFRISELWVLGGSGLSADAYIVSLTQA